MSRNLIYTLFISMLLAACSSAPRNPAELSEQPTIFPDYKDVTIPSNIAPLNFKIEEPGTNYYAIFEGDQDGTIEIASNDGNIKIPENKWSDLLNKNQRIEVRVMVKAESGKWNAHPSFSYLVKDEEADPYIVFRRINTALMFWNDMSIVQRNIESHAETILANNKRSNQNCVHCHTFRNNNAEDMVLHFRLNPGGTLIKTKDKTRWLTTKTPHTLSSFVYPSWHPGGRYIAFSTNKINQSFYAKSHRVNFVRDIASDIVLYDIDENRVFTTPKLATYDFENLPNWSPDGKTLYFIRARQEIKNLDDSLAFYDLMSIGFNPETEEWGEVDTLIAASAFGKSISFPECSPDGKHLVFCLSDQGYFTIGNPTTDLYLLNLASMEYHKLELNSDKTESWHSWSSNGRWMVFASKRIDGLITIPHISYIDESGHASKPFPIPVENPYELKNALFNFNRPVFLKNRIQMDQNDILSIINQKPEDVWFDTLTVDIDAIAGATRSGEILPMKGIPGQEN